MAVTKQQAMTCLHFETPVVENADGTPQRWKANGRCKTWKTRPFAFRLPIKFGLNKYGYLTDDNAHFFDAVEGNSRLKI